MKPYRFENTPLLKAFSEWPGSDNELDRCRVNEGWNRIETNAVTNETVSLEIPQIAYFPLKNQNSYQNNYFNGVFFEENEGSWNKIDYRREFLW